MDDSPETRYATSGDVQIAYQAFGVGPVLVWVPGWVSQLDLYWEEPALARFLRRLASFARVVVFDRRGLGLSDRVSLADLPTLEVRMDDVRAVLDDLDVGQAAVLGQGYGSPIALLFAATYPERTSSLVLYSPSAKGGLATDDYPWGSKPAEQEAWLASSTKGGERPRLPPSGSRGSLLPLPATSARSNGRRACCGRREARRRRGRSPR